MAYDTEDHAILYCFPAMNSSCIKGKRSALEYNVMYIFFSLLSLWTVFVNLLVIISISYFKKLHTPTNLIILSLAVSDMLIGLIVMPLEALRLIETCWYFGNLFCKLFMVVMGLLLSASLSNLILIAVDRYVAICHPLMYTQKITTTRTLTCIYLCWISSTAYNVALVTNISHGIHVCDGKCTVMLSFEGRVADLFFSFMFPCTLIIILHLRIFYVAYQQVKVINSLMKTDKCLTNSSVRKKSEHKAALTLGIIVAIHLLCWIPYYILTLTEDTLISSTSAYFLIWALYVNSCLNPLIYALFYTWFRKSVSYILSLRIFQQAYSRDNIFPDHHA